MLDYVFNQDFPPAFGCRKDRIRILKYCGLDVSAAAENTERGQRICCGRAMCVTSYQAINEKANILYNCTVKYISNRLLTTRRGSPPPFLYV